MPRRSERWTTKPRLPITTPLTPRQQEAIDAVAEHLERKGYSPTSRELGKMLGCNQTAASNLVEACVRKGKLKRVPGMARTITIVQ